MNLAASRSARLKNKLVMRLGCVLVAVGFLVSSVVTPRARAVAVVDDVAVGAMSCAAFLESIGLPLSATGGAGVVTGGITAVAGEYAAATGAAASGEAVLGSIAAGTVISTAGTIILSAAAVAACAALAYWLCSTYFFDEDGNIEVDVPVNISSVSLGYLLKDGSYLSVLDGYPYDWEVGIPFEGATVLEAGVSYSLANGRTIFCNSAGNVSVGGFSAHLGGETTTYQFCTNGGDLCVAGSVVYSTGRLVKRTNNFSHVPSYYFGELNSSNLSASVRFDYSIPEIQPNQSMEITIPSAAPGSTLAELVETVPQQVVDGTLSATYTIDTTPPSPPSFSGGDMEDIDDLGLPSLGEALTKRFPFSIPWDIAMGITLLAAPAKTPYFEVDFYAPISDLVGGWKGSTKIVLDFSQFESLGRLSRWTSTIGFCLFLASATKRFIWTA